MARGKKKQQGGKGGLDDALGVGVAAVALVAGGASAASSQVRTMRNGGEPPADPELAAFRAAMAAPLRQRSERVTVEEAPLDADVALAAAPAAGVPGAPGPTSSMDRRWGRQ